MRKRISCRVIASNPFIQSEDGLINPYQHTAELNIGGFSHPTHSEPPAMMRIYMDDRPATGILDFYA